MKAPAQNSAEKSSPEAHTVAARGAHHRVWQRDRFLTLPDGRVVNRPTGFTELATGLHYFQDGAWLESRAEFVVTATGAAATRGPHQVFLTGNINAPGAIEIHTADKQVLKFRPVCLAYTDAASGRSVVLAPVRDAEGILFPPNEVLYPAAFTGVRADVRVTYTKAGFESDVILREKLPPPEDYGLDAATTLLEVWHECDAPAPEKSARSVDGLTDETLRFGTMRIGRGTAFSLAATARRHHSPAVSKTWLRTENPARSYLIESVRLPRVQEELDALPDRQAARPQRAPGVPPGGDPGAGKMPAARSRLAQLATLSPPSARAATPVRLAFDMKAVPPAHGLVLDYAVLNSQSDPLTLQADTTYLVSAVVSLTDLIIEGGTVVKYVVGWGAYVEFYGTVDCQTGPYRPAIFTAQDDDTVGDVIAGSTGTPSGFYGGVALMPQSAGNELHDLRFSHQASALIVGGDNVVRHAQFTHCAETIFASFCALTVDNALFYQCEKIFNGLAGTIIESRHLTAQNCFTLASAHEADHAFNLTNALLINVTNWNMPGFGALNYFTNAVVQTTNAAALQTVGAGAHYLATNSPYRNLGTTNLPAALAAELRQRTTYPPLVRSNVSYTTSTTLGLVAPRDTNAPDLGYHYAALDYLATRLSVSNNATLTLAPGVAIAGYGTTNNDDFLVLLGPGGSLVSEGTPLNLNQIVAHAAVQEQTGPRQMPWLIMTPYWAPTAPVGQMRARFTGFSAPAANTAYFHSDNFDGVAPRLVLTDCQLQGGKIFASGLNNISTVLALTNNLLHRVNTVAFMRAGHFYNNTVRGGTLTLVASNSAVFDNLFDDSSLYQILALTNGHNGYTTNVTRLTPLATNDIIVTNVTLAYDNGPLGRFHLPPDSPFQNAGSRGGRAASLYWHTATANQQPETNSPVDLGFHTVALTTTNAATALALDYDLNNLANYLEDFDGHVELDEAEAKARGETNIFLPNYEPIGPSSRRTPLVISEIMYNPTNGFQFVEIYNSHHLTQDISGFTFFIKKIPLSYPLPENTVIPPSSYRSIPFGTLLNTSGDTVQLLNRAGAVLLEVTFNDKPPWPKEADGAGHSLVLARPSYGENDSRAWARSEQRGGSPGFAETNRFELLRAIKINEFLAYPTNGQTEYIELFNASNTNIDVSGCFLSSRSGALSDFQIPTNFVMPSRSFLCFTQGSGAGKFSRALNGTNGDSIFFTSRGQTSVIDAVTFDPQAPGTAMGRSPDGTLGFRALALNSPLQANGPFLTNDIIINEVMFNPISGSAADEYVELRNRGSSSVNVGGWKVSGIGNSDFTIPTNTTPIAAQDYLVVARNRTNLLARYPSLTSGRVVGNYSDTLSDRSEKLTLLSKRSDGAFVVMDQMTYLDGGRWGKWTDGGGSALELVDSRSNNQLAAHWSESAAPSAASWTSLSVTGLVVNGDAASGSVRLELMMLDAGECLVDDVEVLTSTGTSRLNNGNFDGGGTLTSQSWTVQGNHDLSDLAAGLGISGSACLAVRATGRGDYLTNRIHHPLTASFSTGTTCIIKAKVKWQRGHPNLLFRLSGNYLEAVAKMTVPADVGTPGAANSQALANSGPAIDDAHHFPSLPGTNELVTILTRVSDPDGVTNLVVKYRLDPATNYATLRMRDDGGGGDALAADGVFTATLARKSTANIAFVVEATDALGAKSRFPKAEKLFSTDAFQREGVVRVGDPTNASSFGAYRIWMTTANSNRWATRGGAHNGPIDVTFVNGKRTIYNSTARYAGSFSHTFAFNSPVGVPCGYSLDFPSDDRFLGATGLNLDRDDSNGGHQNLILLQSEQLAMSIADRLELPNHYRRFVELYVHGVRRNTSALAYEDTQGPNRDFIEEWFPESSDPFDTGELFAINVWHDKSDPPLSGAFFSGSLERINRAWPGTTNTSLDIPRYRIMWEPKALRSSGEDFAALSNLIVGVASTNSAAYLSNVENQVDYEQWMRVLAFERAVCNFDSYGYHNGQNMFAYHDLNNGLKWKLLMTDFDTVFSFGVSDSGNGVWVNADPFYNANATIVAREPRVEDMKNIPVFRRAFWRCLYDLANTNDGVFLPSFIGPIFSGHQAALLNNSYTPPTATNDQRLDLTWIANRRTYLWGRLPEARPSFLAGIQSLNTNTYFATLTGTAPVEVKGFKVNGNVMGVTWTTVTNWSLSGTLPTGTLTLSGFDRKTNDLPVRDKGDYTTNIVVFP